LAFLSAKICEEIKGVYTCKALNKNRIPPKHFNTKVAWVPLSLWAVSGASMQAIRIVTFCPLAPATRMVSPSPTDTNVAGPAAAAATGFGWLRLGGGVSAGAL